MINPPHTGLDRLGLQLPSHNFLISIIKPEKPDFNKIMETLKGFHKPARCNAPGFCTTTLSIAL